MFKFCKTEIRGIEFIYISKETMVSVWEMLSECFSRAKTIPGTRSFHQFIPLSRGEIATKSVSEDIDYLLKFEFEQVQQVLSLSMVNTSQFVLCTYDSHKWVGMACEVDTAHKDIEIQFMHPPCPSRSYIWQRRDDICWVPITNILCLLKTLSLTKATGRQHYLHNDDQKYIQGITL